jgi:hypothetical protein
VGIGGIELLRVGTLALGLLHNGDAIVVADIFYDVRLACCARLVAHDIVARGKDAVARKNFARFEEGDITDERAKEMTPAIVNRI